MIGKRLQPTIWTGGSRSSKQWSVAVGDLANDHFFPKGHDKQDTNLKRKKRKKMIKNDIQKKVKRQRHISEKNKTITKTTTKHNTILVYDFCFSLCFWLVRFSNGQVDGPRWSHGSSSGDGCQVLWLFFFPSASRLRKMIRIDCLGLYVMC